MEKELPEYIINLYSKCLNLKDNEILKTSFGPDHIYKIEKHNDFFTMFQCGNYWRENRVESSFTFNSSLSLLRNLKTEPYIRYYAVNVFSGNIQFLDNIGNFCNAFKIYEHKKK